MNDPVRVLSKRSLAIAGGLCACILMQGCEKTPPTAPKVEAEAQAATLPAEWEVPIQYRGEWHEKLANCADSRDPTRLVLTADHLTFHSLDGPVQASSTAGLQLTVVAQLTGEGQTLQRAFGFTLSPEQDKLTAVEDGPGITRLRCSGPRS